MKFPPIKEIMTKKVITVQIDTPLLEINSLFNEHRFNGLPVIDSEKRLIGLVTQYDLISNQAAVHFPTMKKVLESLPVFKKDKSEYSEDIKAIANMTVLDIMNPEPLTLLETASFETGMTMFAEHRRINPIPVVTTNNILVGVISRFDIAKAFSTTYSQ